jgi:hypothetical protein
VTDPDVRQGWHRPPAEITPPEFFERWLPRAFREARARAAPDAPVLRVTLSGPDGGQWQVRADDDLLEVTAESRPTAVPGVWIRQSAQDFIAAFRGDPDLPSLLPPSFSPLDLLFLDPRDASAIKQIAGRFLVEVSGKRRRRWALDLAIGAAGMNAGRPRATIALDGATYDGLASGAVAPLRALVDRRLRVEGDRALAMQGLLLLGARLARA